MESSPTAGREAGAVVPEPRGDQREAKRELVSRDGCQPDGGGRRPEPSCLPRGDQREAKRVGEPRWESSPTAGRGEAAGRSRRA